MRWKKAKVGIYPYVLAYEDRVDDSTGKAVDGICDTTSNHIKIDATLPPVRRREVLLHELMHGVCDALNIQLRDEEKFVDPMARGIIMLCQDNPRLMRQLLFGD